MSFNDLIGDIQANAQPRERFLCVVVHLIEALKNFLLMRFCNANPEILHADDRARVIRTKPHDDAVRLRRVLDGVRQEIRHDLPGPLAVSQDVAVDRPLDDDVMPGSRRPDEVNGLVDDGIEVHRLVDVFEAPALDARDTEQVVDECGQLIGLPVHLHEAIDEIAAAITSARVTRPA